MAKKEKVWTIGFAITLLLRGICTVVGTVAVMLMAFASGLFGGGKK